jgi:hypothetical protein
MPWTLLQVVDQPQQGICRCRLLHRYRPPLPTGPGLLGYRCLRLSTTTAHVAIRFVDEKTLEPARNIQVMVSATPDVSAGHKEDLVTNQEGLIRTVQPYQNVAFATVHTGLKVQALIPVEVLDERPILCALKANAEDEDWAALDLRKKHWEARLDESLQITSELFKELGNEKAHETALARAQEGLRNLQEDIVGFIDDRNSLKSDAAKQGPKFAFDLGYGDQRLKKLEEARDKLKDHIAKLDDLIKTVKDPKRQQLLAKIGRAQLLEEEADFPKAMDLYAEIVAEGKDLPGVDRYARRLEQLKQDWALKDDKARAFTYDVWPGLETAAQLKEKKDEAFKALQACRQVGDRLTPLKLLQATTLHMTQLGKRLQSLLASNNEDDRTEGKLITELLEDLKKLTEETTTYLNQGKEATK